MNEADLGPQRILPMKNMDSSFNDARIALERQSQYVATAFVASGLLFMLLPGTFLGVWNLIGISESHTLTSLSPAWLQAHGQAQIFGWIGSFILGIGFYSLTKMQSTRTFPKRSAWAAWLLWTLGAALRWLGGVTAWQWRILLPLSACLALAAFLLFFGAVRRHRPAQPSSGAMPVWMMLVLAATVMFLLTLVLNGAAMLQLALRGSVPALPHVFDQQMVVLAVWGILVPTIWGFNARWLPVFAGFRTPNGPRLLAAYGLSVVGIALVFAQWLAVAAVAFFLAAILSIDALHVWERAAHPAKLLHVHRSFPTFLRIAYAWLLVSCLLTALAVLEDQSGGIWGASRHALTVGFVACMVFTIGQRVLPAFCGMRILWSTRLMFASLALLNFGCLMRVTLEPLAYEGYWRFAWHLLPISAVVELAAVALFALNLFATLAQPPAHPLP